MSEIEKEETEAKRKEIGKISTPIGLVVIFLLIAFFALGVYYYYQRTIFLTERTSQSLLQKRKKISQKKVKSERSNKIVWKTYKNSIYKYSLSFRTDYQRSNLLEFYSLPFFDSIVGFSQKGVKNEAVFRNGITVRVCKSKAVFGTPWATVLDLYKINRKGNVYQSKDGRKLEETELGGIFALRKEIDYPAGEAVLLKKDQESVFVLQYAGDNHREVFEKMVESFKFW